MLRHILFDFLERDFGVSDVVDLAEIGQTLGLTCQTRLNLVHVEESLSADFAGVRTKQDVSTRLEFHLVSKRDGFIELKLLQQSLRELREAVRVGLFFTKDHRQRDGLQSVGLQQGQLDTAFAGLGSRLVVRAAQKEGSDHVAHQVLRSQLDYVEVSLAEVDAISEHGRKHPVGVGRCERENERPMEQAGRLVEHAHRTLCKPASNHLFDLTDRGELGAFA